MVNQQNKGKYCYSYVPARVVFILLGSIAFVLVYAFKVVLSVALVAMVTHSDNNNTDSGTECPISNITNNSNSHTVDVDKFNWNSDQQALLLGAFFYGYVITQIPGAFLAQRFGAKWLLGLSMLTASILSLLGPICAKWNFTAFFLTRFGQGLADGVVFPCAYKMIGKWLPKMERSLGSTIIFTGSQIGTVVTLPLTGYLCDGQFMGGWPAIFYLLGITGCVWFVFWTLFVYENPDTHPHISQKELSFIKEGGENEISTSNGLVSSFPYILQAFMGWLAGLISDKIRKSERVSINVIRKTNNTIAFIGPAICLIAVPLSRCESTLSIVLFTLAMGLNGLSYSGFYCTHVDMSPDFAAILKGLTNTVANIPGFLAPVVANSLTKDNETIKNWSFVFYISSGIYVITALIYLLFASANLQPWGLNKKVDLKSIHSDFLKDDKERSDGFHNKEFVD